MCSENITRHGLQKMMNRGPNARTHIHYDKVEDIGGFATCHAKSGEYLWLLCKAKLTSDDPEFYKNFDQLASVYFAKAKVLVNNVYQFLIILHHDLSADLYLNELPVIVEISLKRNVKKGETITTGDIADIRRLKFQNIQLKETDKVIYCFKVGWKFGLYFDLDRAEDLDLDRLYVDLGSLYRYLSFQEVYKVLESQSQFEEMLKDGWFPFIETLSGEYNKLSEAYSDKFDFDNRVNRIINNFDRNRIEKFTEKWWTNSNFKEKEPLIKAGIEAYLSNNTSGFINCIKNLLTEIEGIIRYQYFHTTGEGKATFTDLLNYIVDKGKEKSDSEDSLFLPSQFLKYLKDVAFAAFDLESGKLDLSRHSSSHGVAKPHEYTKTKALQALLILDQVYFYINQR